MFGRHLEMFGRHLEMFGRHLEMFGRHSRSDYNTEEDQQLEDSGVLGRGFWSLRTKCGCFQEPIDKIMEISAITKIWSSRTGMRRKEDVKDVEEDSSRILGCVLVRVLGQDVAFRSP